MSVPHETMRRLLDRGDFEALFIEHLGWDNPPSWSRTIVLPEDEIAAEQIASKRGVGVWRIDGIPPSIVRRRVDVEVSRRTRERLLVFVDDQQQLWLWPEQRASGSGGHRLIEHRYHPGAQNEALLQRIGAAAFTLVEEASLTVMDVLSRIRRSFNAEEVTKRFYREFKRHHDSLLDQIEGIEDQMQLSWYGSVLLNRLMFIYFLQKKGFLDDDRNYLRNRLALVRQHLGPDAFYGFFREFLLPLFHQGLGSHLHEYRDPKIAELIGDVPYVNGGIFSPHLLEELYKIDVPDRAFEEIFQFFDRYRWHLDERPSDDPNEINPDVLGYIFEQYVNQKEQGAYYTKEDVTGYMTAVTVIPALVDRLGVGEQLWMLLSSDPDRYIPEPLRYGVDAPLPHDIGQGIDDPDLRAGWSDKADPAYGLPGETWWEVVDRRRHYLDLRRRLADGAIRNVAEAISANLDLRTLLNDHIRLMNTVEEIEEAYRVLTNLTILDPTCGSGAFLFAALDILEELYEALFDRADELSADDRKPAFLGDVKSHPNRSYFILKTALLNNLYGVDIMYEAGEIARLRLFLKLVAQLSRREELEPLPDLDFNIRTGNLLVGIATVEDAKVRLGTDLFGVARLDEIEEAAEDVSRLYEEFVISQKEATDPAAVAELKVVVSERLRVLREDLDRLLHEARGEPGDVTDWVKTHQPFHWFVEFPSVFRNGGFDVIIGNPPYIARTKVTTYRWVGLKAGSAPDIYAPCVERAVNLARSDGLFTMVVPHSLCFSDDYSALRDALREKCSSIWLSSFALMPDSLFTGVRIRNTIIVAARGSDRPKIWSGWRNRWTAEARPFLFGRIRYTPLSDRIAQTAWPFLGSAVLGDWFERQLRTGESFDGSFSVEQRPETELRYKKVAGYYVSMWPQELGDPPSVDANGNPIPPTEVGSVWAASKEALNRIFAIAIGKWFFAWWAAYGDDFHVTKGVISSFPVDVRRLPPAVHETIDSILPELFDTLRANVTYKGYKYRGKPGARIANYYIPAARAHTDVIDRAIARAIADEDAWWAVNVCHAHLSRMGDTPED